ncbi:MAG: hypothetical protein IAE80_26560, partial [Anaerolinea sp.]|nr:hypothetical protein [Anaerolinea sp.]
GGLDLYIKFEDENGNRVGGRDVYVDLATLTFAEGVATITVTPSANGAELKCANTSASDAVITKLEIRGRKILDKGEIEVTSLDSGSIIDFGRRTLRMNMPSLDNAQQAQYISDFERNRRKAPKGMVEAVSLKSHGLNGGSLHTEQLVRTIGDLIRVEETQSGHEGDYYIIGEAHELTQGATLWQTTWYLEPAPPQTALPWQLGVGGRSELGSVTRLAY